MAHRAAYLFAAVALALVFVACGRASDVEIDQALGITPTPTQSPEDLATATAAAAASAEARVAALAGPSSETLGDAVRGRRQFATWCVACHGPAGRGGALLEPGGPGSSVDPDALLALVRDGTGHGDGPMFQTTEISDAQVLDLAAYIRSEAGS